MKKTYCAKCLRTSEVVDMSNCPFCSEINKPPLPMDIEKAYPEAYRLARRFHELYEQSAPAFGYETKKETKQFDPESANGRLMAWVCYEIVKEEKQRILADAKDHYWDSVAKEYGVTRERIRQMEAKYMEKLDKD